MTDAEIKKLILENQPLTRADFKKSFDQVVRLVQMVQSDITKQMGQVHTTLAKQNKDDLESFKAGILTQVSKKLAEVKNGIDGKNVDHNQVVKDIMKNIRQPKDDETPVIDHQKIAQMAASLIPPLKPVDENLLSAKIIDTVQKNIENNQKPITIETIGGIKEYVVDVVSKHAYSGGGGASVSVLQSGTLKVQAAAAMNFKGAGAPTVTIGANGVTNLDFPSGGSATLYTQTPTGLINGSNKAYTTLHSITTVIGLWINGQFIHPAEYTVSGAGFTMTTALDSSLSGLGFTISYT